MRRRSLAGSDRQTPLDHERLGELHHDIPRSAPMRRARRGSDAHALKRGLLALLSLLDPLLELLFAPKLLVDGSLDLLKPLIGCVRVLLQLLGPIVQLGDPDL